MAFVCLATVACAESRSGAPRAAKAATAPVSPSATASALVAQRPAGGFAECMAAGDFRGALARIDSLPPEKREEPEIRYVRARAMMALGEHAGACPPLQGLSERLPVIARRVLRDEAECALAIGPFDRAASYFEAAGDPGSLVKAALAMERAGKPEPARRLLDRALISAKTTRDPEVVEQLLVARASRARVASATGDVAAAIADLRWLAAEAPATEAGRAAMDELSRSHPKARLTTDERLARAKRLAEGGQLETALAELTELEAAGSAATRVLLRARAEAHYVSRTSYEKASALYDELARLGGAEAPRDAFLAARALSRAQRDPEAIERYEALVQRFPSCEQADEASYQAARLRLLSGRWDDAVSAYQKYLSRRGGPRARRFAPQARYELALSLLAGRHGKEAAALFHDLSGDESDPLERGELTALEAAAVSESGDGERAAELFGAVVREMPLTFPALVSAARLDLMGRTREGREVMPPRAAGLSVELPVDVALLSRVGLVDDAEDALEDHEGELRARYAPRGAEALCAAYGRIGSGSYRLRTGRSAVKKATFEHLPTAETRWAWECVYPEPFGDTVATAESLRGLPAGILHSIMRQESAFDQRAVSSASAVGLLQLMPDTAARVARELSVASSPELLRSPAHNIELGSYYFRKVLDTFGGHVALAAAAYNAGPKAVSRWLATGETLPLDLWVARIPYAETRGYVARVLGNFARYSYLRDGSVAKISLDLPRGVRVTERDY